MNILNMLVSNINSYNNKGKGLVTDYGYYREESEKLKNVPCPTCKEVGGMFKGFWYVQCHKCVNCFKTEKEMLEHITTEAYKNMFAEA